MPNKQRAEYISIATKEYNPPFLILENIHFMLSPSEQSTLWSTIFPLGYLQSVPSLLYSSYLLHSKGLGLHTVPSLRENWDDVPIVEGGNIEDPKILIINMIWNKIKICLGLPPLILSF